MKTLRIGEIARETGLSVKAIRFYERIGLIPGPERSLSSGYRLYGPSDLKRLRLIQRAKLLGLKLSQIRGLVGVLKAQGCDCSRIKPRLRRTVNRQLEEIERKIQELTHLRRELRKIQKGSAKAPLPRGFCLCSETELVPLRPRSAPETSET